MRAAFVVRDNLRNRRTIQRAYLQAIGQAKKSVLLANPYFAPGRKFREALEAKQGRKGEDHIDSGSSPVHAHGPVDAKRTFRRKTGG